jgi:penicillin-binding protein 1A
VLVPPHVAAGITDLLQSAVATGTGRAAQIGRPVAGKTGTTSSNKDGWFLGFSSGITTGVWMGRDDAKPVPGLQGGQAPASAFAAYMTKAVRGRPIKPFDTELKLPDWQLEPDDELMTSSPDDYYYTDENGNLIQPGGPRRQGPGNGAPRYEDGTVGPGPGPGGYNEQPAGADDDFLEQATGRGRRDPRDPNARDPGLRAAPPPPGTYRQQQQPVQINPPPPQ